MGVNPPVRVPASAFPQFVLFPSPKGVVAVVSPKFTFSLAGAEPLLRSLFRFPSRAAKEGLICAFSGKTVPKPPHRHRGPRFFSSLNRSGVFSHLSRFSFPPRISPPFPPMASKNCAPKQPTLRNPARRRGIPEVSFRCQLAVLLTLFTYSAPCAAGVLRLPSCQRRLLQLWLVSETYFSGSPSEQLPLS